MSAIKVETKGGKTYIASPYNADFVQRIKLMGGSWDSQTRRWVIQTDALDAARQVMKDIYGETDEAPALDTVTLVLEFQKEMYKDLAPITIAGKTIASAFSRDGGARVGEDVAFISGAPESCGSKKNWGTCIPEGSVCEVYHVPKAVAEATVAAASSDPDPKYKASIKGASKPDREKLLAEKKVLLGRLHEIDMALDRLDP